MFTSTMTYEEILHEAQADFYELTPQTQIAFNRFRRKYSPAPGGSYNLFGPLSEKKTFKTRRHNIWTLEMHVNSFYSDTLYGGSVMFTAVPRSNGTTEYLFIWNHGAFIPELLSTHFVQRYKERYLEPNHIDLRGMHPALYFQRKNTDLRRTYFIPNQWTEEDLKNKQVWISNQGLFITVNHGMLRVYVTFLDQQNLTNYKALVYEEEAQRRMYENISKKYKNNTIQSAWFLLPMFTAPNAREIYKRFVKRICDAEGEEREKFIRTAMDAWDGLEKATRDICDAVIKAYDEEQLKKRNFEVPGVKEYVDSHFGALLDKQAGMLFGGKTDKK